MPESKIYYMESKIFPGLPPDELKRVLTDNADQVENTTYMKSLTETQLAERREKLVENSIQLGIMEDELDSVKAEYKIKMKPLKLDNANLLTQLKHKQAEVKGFLYHIASHEEGMMGTYDENGELISSRRLRPDEKQLHINHLSKAQ